MNSIRRWLYRPKRSDSSLLAQFFYADEDLNMVAAELDSFDGRKDPERCTALVNQLRSCQDKVLNTVQNIMDEAVPGQRASRDFRVKFPDDVIQENLSGQLWFGAECLAAGSSIMNREVESASMRPLARALTKNLDSLRTILREQCLRNINEYTERIKEALIIFDKLFAEFELSYVSAMVPVKTMKEYDTIQEITVLFSETVQRALNLGLLSQEMIDEYDPALMFTIPRLAIVSGLLAFPEGPLNPDNDPWNMSDMFRPFQTLLYKIRELLYTLAKEELYTLERALCSAEEPSFLSGLVPPSDSVDGYCQTELEAEQCVDAFASTGEVSYYETIGGPLIIHTPNSGSPVTPVANTEFSIGTMSNSPSCITVIERTREGSREEEDVKDNSGFELNKCDSNDSGLHSENVSTSDSIYTASSSDSQQTLNVTLTESPSSQGEVSPAVVVSIHGEASMRTFTVQCDAACMEECIDLDDSCGCDVEEYSENVNCMCREIVDDIVYHSFDQTQDCYFSDKTHESSRSSDSLHGLPVGHCSLSRGNALDSQNLALCDDIDDNDNQHSITENSAIESASSVDVLQTTDFRSISHPNYPSVVIHDSETPFNFVNNQETSAVVLTSSNSSHQGSNCHHKHHHGPQIPSNCLKQKREKKHHNGSLSNTNPFDRLHAKTGAPCIENDESACGECLAVPRIQRLRYAESLSSSCSSCRSGMSSVASDCEWDRESCASSETSSYNSECHDDEEIALAIQAAELASRNEARSRFRSSSDMIHRLFVCISGVADQLQTNFASDLRNILRSVFDINCSEPLIMADNKIEAVEAQTGEGSGASTANEGYASRVRSRGPSHRQSYRYSHTSEPRNRSEQNQDPPDWIPDDVSPLCMSCRIPFTFVRRRHHCRNCGKIFCGRCSSNSVPLPHYGHAKPVRVCNRCFMFQVTPFTMANTS